MLRPAPRCAQSIPTAPAPEDPAAPGRKGSRRVEPLRIDLLVLNHNGHALLSRCLPSIVAAARRSRHDCGVVVVDNASSDGSQALVDQHFAGVDWCPQPNRGLCSLNLAAARSTADLLLLLNNDVLLAADAVDPLADEFTAHRVRNAEACFAAAPLCWGFDGLTYDGQKTSLRWRFGLISASSVFEQHLRGAACRGLTASAGAALMVDREKFLELGGFDARYLPGRIEDLDLAFRAAQRGWNLWHVPQAVAYHRGQASFAPTFGTAGCDHLALRNTLLFQWRHAQTVSQRMALIAGCLARAVRDVAFAWRVPSRARWPMARAWRAAQAIHRQQAPSRASTQLCWVTRNDPKPVRGLGQTTSRAVGVASDSSKDDGRRTSSRVAGRSLAWFVRAFQPRVLQAVANLATARSVTLSGSTIVLENNDRPSRIARRAA